MSFGGMSKEEQELTSMLSKTLVQKEVIEPLDKIGWRPGTPPPPDYSNPAAGQPGSEGAPGQAAAPAPAAPSGQPATEAGGQPAPAGQPKADSLTYDDLVAGYEALRDPETGLIARKYSTVAEAIKGGVHLTHMAKQAFSERDAALRDMAALREENMKLRQTPVAAPPSPATPVVPQANASSREALVAAKAKLSSVQASIIENGGVLNEELMKSLSDAQIAVSEAAADVRVQERLASTAQAQDQDKAEWAQVDKYMTERYPESIRFSEEVALHLQSDPLLTKAVNALLAQNDKIGATEMAWQSFAAKHSAAVANTIQTKAEAKEEDLAAREQVRQEALAAARKDAGVVTGSAGGAGVHESRNTGASREEVAALTEAIRREGDAPGSPAAMRFRQLIIGPSLDPSYFPRG